MQGVVPRLVGVDQDAECVQRPVYADYQDDLQKLLCDDQSVVESLVSRVAATGRERGHLKHLESLEAPTLDAPSGLAGDRVVGYRRDAHEPRDLASVEPAQFGHPYNQRDAQRNGRAPPSECRQLRHPRLPHDQGAAVRPPPMLTATVSLCLVLMAECGRTLPLQPARADHRGLRRHGNGVALRHHRVSWGGNRESKRCRLDDKSEEISHRIKR